MSRSGVLIVATCLLLATVGRAVESLGCARVFVGEGDGELRYVAASFRSNLSAFCRIRSQPAKVSGVPCSTNRDQLAHGEGGDLIVLFYPEDSLTLPISLLNRSPSLRCLVPSSALLGKAQYGNQAVSPEFFSRSLAMSLLPIAEALAPEFS